MFGQTAKLSLVSEKYDTKGLKFTVKGDKDFNREGYCFEISENRERNVRVSYGSWEKEFTIKAVDIKELVDVVLSPEGTIVYAGKEIAYEDNLRDIPLLSLQDRELK